MIDMENSEFYDDGYDGASCDDCICYEELIKVEDAFADLEAEYKTLRGQYSDIAIVSGFQGDGLYGDATVDHEAILDKVKRNAEKAWLYEQGFSVDIE